MGTALLINPSYVTAYGSNEGALISPVFPVLSLATLAAGAIQRGHDCRILDLSHLTYDPEKVKSVIASWRPDVVGITATTPLANQMRDLSYLVKDVSHDILTVGGGPHASALPDHMLGQSELDLVVCGEADFLLADLLDGATPGSLSGVHVRGSDRGAAPRRLIENLDDLPIPRWDVYPHQAKRMVSTVVARHWPLTTIEFSRGCIYRCDFCGSKNTMGLGYRKKSPDRCAEEMVNLARLGFREALVVDDIFTSDINWAAEVCEAIIRRAPGVAWTCSNGIRVDSADPELFRLMRRAGCYRVGFGFESGNDDVIRRFGKGGRATLANAESAVRLCRGAGIEVNGYFMIGLLGDDEFTMKETVDFARSMPLDAMKCGITIPFPGTPMFTSLHEGGNILTYDWDEYTVYNDAGRLYRHPTLSWYSIQRAFRRFYRRNLVGDPAYLVRRFQSALRNREVWANVKAFLGIVRLAVSRRRHAAPTPYLYEDRWRQLDLTAHSDLPSPQPVRSSKGLGPQGRDGFVTSAAEERHGSGRLAEDAQPVVITSGLGTRRAPSA